MLTKDIQSTATVSSTAGSLFLAIPSRENWEIGFQSLCEFLSQKLLKEVKLIVGKDFDDVQKLVQQKKADFGIFTSTSYVRTKELYKGLKYIATGQTVEDGKSRSYYPGFFIVHSDSKYKCLADLKDAPFAFVSTSSSSGYKYPIALLKSHAIDAKNYFGNLMFLGDHSYVTDAVATKVADAGVTWDLNLSKAVLKHGDVFRIIGQYGPIVNHAFAAGDWVEESLCKAVAEFLTALPDEVTNTPGFPYSGFEILSDSAYGMAREVEKMDRVSVEKPSVQRSLSIEEFRSEALKKALNVLQEVRIVEENKLNEQFVKREPTPLISYQTVPELANAVKLQLASMIESFPNLEKLANSFQEPLNTIFNENSNSVETLEAFQLILKVANEWLGIAHREDSGEFNFIADQQRIVYKVQSNVLDQVPQQATALADDIEDTRFLTLVSRLNEQLREKSLRPTPAEQIIINAAYVILSKGANLRGSYKSLGISGFRKIHTYLFNTNPGEGHIAVTCNDLQIMKGTAVHIEHIDRDKLFDKEKVEPYRLAAAINAAKVSLHVGSHAPCTAYIGRPVFESGNFALDLLKSVHKSASACTAMFMNGIADCKIGMERMTATEAIKFMRYVAGNVIRDSSRQYLAAAFNINTPIVDDRPETLEINTDSPVTLTNRMEIARLAIELTKQGGFERVTWDGASNEVPSVPILGQLSHEQVVMLVHEAHKRGLQTYISAGLEPYHMRDAVFTGVDGVGIGTSLHYIDPETKLMGALKPDAIREALRIRDEAEASIQGKAAILLARLDRMFFEGSLPEEDELHSASLYEAVLARDVQQAQKVMNKLAHIMTIDTRE
jgi:phosphate/phosphite/phosphonate ABC transporter binding protein